MNQPFLAGAAAKKASISFTFTFTWSSDSFSHTVFKVLPSAILPQLNCFNGTVGLGLAFLGLAINYLRGGGEIRFRYGASAREKREGGGVAITYMEQLLGHQGQGEAEERHGDREGAVEGDHQGQEGVEARIHQVVRQARQG